MKTLRLHFLLLLSFCFAMNAHAQIPDGTTAPDWTATDLDGNSWTMYDMLNSGKHVVLEFSATWCGPCWNFHNTGTMESLHDMYGPDGTDQIRVFYIEADQSTNTACLYGPVGCNSSTQGDWVTGHDFPFIDLMPGNANSMDDDYQVGYFPTVYAVSANSNGVYRLDQETDLDVWASWFFESFEMQMSADVTDAVCPGEGAIQLNVTNGAGTINYEWSNGTWGSDNITGLEAGSYSVTATDDNGYELIETYEVSGTMEGPVMVELLASSDVLCFGENSGALQIDGSGGNGGYSYAWSNGATGTYVDGLIAGTYTVQVTDQFGCLGSETYTITEPEILTLTTLPEDANCGAEDGGVVAFATGGTSPWTYDYGSGPNFTGTFEGVAPGDYMMTVTDANSCAKMTPFSVGSTEGPMIAADVSDDIDCSIVEVIVSGEGSSEGADIEYSWTTEDGNIVEGADALEATVDAAGTYTLLVTDTGTGCAEEMSVTVEANIESPVSMIEAPETLTCTTTSTVIDASESSSGDNFTYSWTSSSDGNITSGANTNMAEVDQPGDYTLLITNTDNGCTTSETVSVALDNALPAVSVEDKVIDCTTTEVQLCADVEENTSVTWMTDSGEVEADCITVSMAGTFTATAKGANGCEATADAVVTLSADLPQVSIEMPETITCTVPSVMIEAGLEGNAEDFDISWTNEAGDVINSADLSIEVSDAGMYTLSVTNPTNGCTTVSSVTVDEVIINPVSAFSTNLNDGTLELTNNSTGDPSSYSWSFGSTDENPTADFGETGTYEVCLTVTNDCGDNTYCEDVYFVSQLLFETAKEDASCYGEASGMISVTPSGGEPGYSISWVGPNGYTSTDLEISGLVAGEYSMVLTDNFGYEKTASYTLVEPSDITQSLVEITDETNDDGNGSISIEVEGGTGTLSYEWSNGETTQMIDGLSAGEYSVDVTDENGCTKTFGPFNVGNSVGLTDLELVSAMQIYPVPAVNYVTVNIELNNAEATQMRIVDAYGKIISTDNFNAKEINARIDVTNLPAGIYYMEFGNEKGRTLEKFVVVR